MLGACCVPGSGQPLPCWEEGPLAKQRGAGRALEGPLPRPSQVIPAADTECLPGVHDLAWHRARPLSGPRREWSTGTLLMQLLALVSKMSDPVLLGGPFITQRQWAHFTGN